MQTILGWSSADMLRIYDDRSSDEQLEKYFDGNGIKKIKEKGLKDL